MHAYFCAILLLVSLWTLIYIFFNYLISYTFKKVKADFKRKIEKDDQRTLLASSRGSQAKDIKTVLKFSHIIGKKTHLFGHWQQKILNVLLCIRQTKRLHMRSNNLLRHILFLWRVNTKLVKVCIRYIQVYVYVCV